MLAVGLGTPAAAQATLTTIQLASGFDKPVWVGAAAGDHTRLFVLEQHRARVRVVKNGSVLPAPLLDLGGAVATGAEQGLLGMAFHPNWRSNGALVVCYTRTDNAVVLERYTLSAANPDVADPQSRLTILVMPRSQPIHNGGAIQFGPDGYLYVATGDGGGQNCDAQLGTSWLGKMLRLDLDNGTPYTVPASNPFVGQSGILPEIWHFGWRNPWRFSFDRQTGDLWVGDVGEARLEEVSFAPGSSPGGENFGWETMEGTLCYGTCPGPPCGDPRLTLPIHTYPIQRGGDCSIIGGYVYRGCALSAFAGTYFFADYCSGALRSLRFDGTTVSQLTDRTAELDPPGPDRIDNPTAFGEDAHGELLIVDHDGEIYQVIAAGPAVATDLGYGKPAANGQTPWLWVCGRLEAGLRATLSLRRTPPWSSSALLLSTTFAPTAFPFGTLVPLPALALVPFTTDARGELHLPIPGGLGPAIVYAQCALFDPTASGGIGVSNALRITFP